MPRRFLALVAIATLVLVSLAVIGRSTVHADSCSTQVGVTSGINTTITISVSAGDSIAASQLPTRQQVRITWPDGSTIQGAGSVSGKSPSAGTAKVLFINVINGTPYSIIVCTAIGSGGPAGYFGPIFYDGRLNDKDGQETSAVYCMDDGSIRVYVLGSPNWTIDFDASPAEIAKVPTNPAHNMLIKKGHFSSLARQRNGLLLVSSPGLNPIDGSYTFTFKDCPKPSATPQQAGPAGRVIKLRSGHILLQ